MTSTSSSSSCCPPTLTLDWSLVSQMNRRQKLVVASAASALLLSALLGFLLSFGLTLSSTSLLSRLSRDRLHTDPWVTDAVLDRIGRQSLREYLAWISRQPHTAGHARDAEIASWIVTMFRDDLRMDHVGVSTYEVLLSFPSNEGRSNRVELMTDTATEVVFSSAEAAGAAEGGTSSSSLSEGMGGMMGSSSMQQMMQQDLFLSALSNTSLLYPYSAYSPSGEIDGNLVYVNYGRQSDFLKLKDLQLSVTDRIVIARLGQIYRGNKVTNAQEHGARAVILYPDPEDVARQGEGPENVYPHTDWLPETGVPRGTVMTADGDPMTPGWPSLPGAYRIARSYSLPLIPVQPVSYSAARRLLNCLGGKEPPHGWTGRLRGASYRLGGEFTPESGIKKARVTVNNRLANFNVSNVVGVIRGEVEPDRYVIVGAHRDSWGFGAMNPSTATAAVVKVAEAFARTVEETGWRPRRTLAFVSWGAEEFGSVGSSEWVEENLPKLMGRAVAYVNSDVCVSGPDLEATASAALKKVVVEAMRHVRDPRNEDRSYYDYWMEARGRGMMHLEMNSASPSVVRDLVSESDHGPFAFSAGIPSVNVRLTNPKHGFSSASPSSTAFPTHHTSFDNFRLYETVVDPDFAHLQTCARLLAFVARRLADSRVLPYDVEEYGRRMEAGIQALKDSHLFPHNVTLDHLEGAVRSFSRQARNWTERVNATTDFDNPLAVRMLNDQIMGLDRIFIMPGGLPTQNGTREGDLAVHAIFAPSKHDVYGVGVFPGIADILHSEESTSSRWNVNYSVRTFEMLKKHISDLMIVVHQATLHLAEFHAL